MKKFLKQLEKYREEELAKIARRKKKSTKESEVKCPIKSKHQILIFVITCTQKPIFDSLSKHRIWSKVGFRT